MTKNHQTNIFKSSVQLYNETDIILAHEIKYNKQ
jgi:hypothetical protein